MARLLVQSAHHLCARSQPTLSKPPAARRKKNPPQPGHPQGRTSENLPSPITRSKSYTSKSLITGSCFVRTRFCGSDNRLLFFLSLGLSAEREEPSEPGTRKAGQKRGGAPKKKSCATHAAARHSLHVPQRVHFTTHLRFCLVCSTVTQVRRLFKFDRCIAVDTWPSTMCRCGHVVHTDSLSHKI